jgi:hypothetical protein
MPLRHEMLVPVNEVVWMKRTFGEMDWEEEEEKN